MSYVEQEKRTKQNANALVDGVLVKAVKVKKNQKPKLTKAMKQQAKEIRPLSIEDQVMRMFGNSTNPLDRETARQIAGMLWGRETMRQQSRKQEHVCVTCKRNHAGHAGSICPRITVRKLLTHQMQSRMDAEKQGDV